MKKLNDILVYLFLLLCITGIILGIFLGNSRKDSSSSFPIEEIRIDSITKVNETIIIEVNNLDSIKNAKIIEVKAINNDSTLKLFYELISE